MKIKAWVHLGTIDSKIEETIDLETLGISDNDWNHMSKREKDKVVETWAKDYHINIGWEEQ